MLLQTQKHASRRQISLMEAVISLAIVGVLFATVLVFLSESSRAVTVSNHAFQGTVRSASLTKPITDTIKEAKAEFIKRRALPSIEQPPKPSFNNPNNEFGLWALLIPSARDINSHEFVVDGAFAQYVRAVIYCPRISAINGRFDLVRYDVAMNPSDWSEDIKIESIGTITDPNASSSATIVLSNGLTVDRSAGRVVASSIGRFHVFDPDANGLISIVLEVVEGSGQGEVRKSHTAFARPGSS